MAGKRAAKRKVSYPEEVSQRQRAQPARKGYQIPVAPFYIALAVVFVLFIALQGVHSLSSILGIILFMLIVVIIALEVTNSLKGEHGIRGIAEMAIAVLAVVVVFFLLRFLLHTSYPIDVVPSCSMLPNLKRGDLITIYGIYNVSQLRAPIVNVSKSEYAGFQQNISGEFMSCVAYKASNGRAYISQLVEPGYSIGLYDPANGGEIVNPSSQSGLIRYSCGSEPIRYSNGTTANEAYTKSITINGTTVYENRSNSIIVYATIPQDYFYRLGDSYIVHRAYAIIDSGGNYTILTKGDNNPGLDIQYGNYPISIKQVEGKVLFAVPYVGYLKLVLSNSFVEPSGCNSTVQYP